MKKYSQSDSLFTNPPKNYLLVLFIYLLLINILGCKPKGTDQVIGMSVTKSDSLFFPKSGIKVFLVAKAWGIAGNSEQTLIVSNQSRDTIKLFTSEILYKKVGDDSLFIYASEGTIPPNLNGNFKGVSVLVIGLNNYDTIDYRANYRNYGLSKLSAIY